MTQDEIINGIKTSLREENSPYDVDEMMENAKITTVSDITEVTYDNGVIDRFKVILIPTLLHESEWGNNP